AGAATIGGSPGKAGKCCGGPGYSYWPEISSQLRSRMVPGDAQLHSRVKLNRHASARERVGEFSVRCSARSCLFVGARYFFFTSRVIHTRITAPTKETTIDPINPPAWRPSNPNTQRPTI